MLEDRVAIYCRQSWRWGLESDSGSDSESGRGGPDSVRGSDNVLRDEQAGKMRLVDVADPSIESVSIQSYTEMKKKKSQYYLMQQ